MTPFGAGSAFKIAQYIVMANRKRFRCKAMPLTPVGAIPLTRGEVNDFVYDSWSLWECPTKPLAKGFSLAGASGLYDPIPR